MTETTRTSKGLVDMLFTTIDRLNAREIDAEHARAVSHTARSIVAVARLELQYLEMVNSGDKEQPQLTSLQVISGP